MPPFRWTRFVVAALIAAAAPAVPASAAVVFESGNIALTVGRGPATDRTDIPIPAAPFSLSPTHQSVNALDRLSAHVSVTETADGLVISGDGTAVMEPGGTHAAVQLSFNFCVEDPGDGSPPALAQTARVAFAPEDAHDGQVRISAGYRGPELAGQPDSGQVEVDLNFGTAAQATLDEQGESRIGCTFLQVGAGVSDNELVTVPFDRIATAEFEFELRIGAGAPPPDDECEGEELTWAAGRAGAFGDPESWSPPQVPAFEDGGPCDTARVEGGGVVTIDLASALSRASEPLVELVPRGVDRRAGRLHVFDTRELRLQGGTLVLDALNPALGERSLEVSNAGGLLLADGAVAARHVGIGSGAGPGGQIEVVGPGGSLSTTARLGIGGGGEGRLLVREGGRVTSAESMLGESAPGSAVVEDAASLWRTGNFTVGYGSEGSLDVQDGARVESDAAFVGRGLALSQYGAATVGGADAQGNRATWTTDSLEIRNGNLSVEAGGLVDVAGELLLPLNSDPNRFGQVSLFAGSQLSASSVSNEAGLVFINDDGLLFATGTVSLGASPAGTSGASLIVSGPASSAQISGPELLEIQADSTVSVRVGGRVELLGTFNAGTEPGSRAKLIVFGARPQESLLRANEADVFGSHVGAFSEAPAAERLAPTGTLRLEGGRIELQGPKHDLVVERLGRLQAAGGSLSIETPGELINQGVVEGPFILEAPYVQGPTGTRRATILFEGTPAARARALDLIAAAEFPRRAVRKKPALPVAGPLVVMGDATLAGRVELQFGNGVAPRAGESFAVLDVSGQVTGSFAEVGISGLVPGSFAFEPSLAGGKLALTSTMDAVALPAVSVKAKAKLKETAKKGRKIKLKRTGDTSAPLLVAYTVGGTAQPGVDYEALPGVIEIPARKKSATIVLRPLADGLVEGPETIELELAPNEAFAPGIASSATIELVSKDR